MSLTPVLNPSFTTQGSRPLPFIVGYANGSGDKFLSVIDLDASRYGFFALSDGECDGFEQACFNANTHLYAQSSIPPTGGLSSVYKNNPYLFPSSNCFHFHAGQWSTIGTNNVVDNASSGPDQGFDVFLDKIPTATPHLPYNNIAYVACAELYVNSSPGNRATVTIPDLLLYGVFRGARCRYFDANGNVTGYGFTTNPVWQRIEMILRYKVKRQQPQIAGLTDAEKAFFNWPSIVACAQRDDLVLANGANRFTGNHVFAANATLASLLETSCRDDRSFIDDPDGKVGFYGLDAVDSSFTVTRDHLVAGSFRIGKKDLTRAPNVFVPKFRDINIPAEIACTEALHTNAGYTGGSVTVPEGTWSLIISTNGQNPFSLNNILYYGNETDPSLNGDWMVSANPDPTVAVPPIICSSSLTGNKSVGGGYVGTSDSRFAQRSPRTVQHRRHQLAAGMVSPGVPALPNVVPVEYDLGNMSYDQANRLMQYEMNSTLGNDVAGWQAPKTGTMSLSLYAVDANGNAFIRMRPNQRFTLDDTVNTPEDAGDYLIDAAMGGITINPPRKQDKFLGSIDVGFRTFNPNAYSDVSYTPDDSLRTIPSAALKYVNSSLQMANVAWTLQATPVVTVTGSTLSVAIPDLTLQILGRVGFTAYGAAAVWAGLTPGQIYTLYVVDPAPGSTPQFGAQPHGLPLIAGEPYWYVVMVASFAADGTTVYASQSPVADASSSTTDTTGSTSTTTPDTSVADTRAAAGYPAD